jgi:hypothetical protein
MRTKLEYQFQQVAHSGERGEHGERELTNFLRDNLPDRYGVNKGFVVAEDGSVSHAADIVVHDALFGPSIHTDDDRFLFPIETVLAVIEVTLSLDSQKLRDDAGKLAAVKRMPRQPAVVRTSPGLIWRRRTPIPLGCIFGFSSEVSLVTLAQSYSGLNLPPEETVDLVCALDKGTLAFVHREEDRPLIGRATHGGAVTAIASADDALFLFFAVLLAALDTVDAEPPNLFAYLERAGYPPS